MTPEELAALARQAGILPAALSARSDTANFHSRYQDAIARFAALVAEHCALVCEGLAMDERNATNNEEAASALDDGATAIRTAFPMPKKDTPT